MSSQRFPEISFRDALFDYKSLLDMECDGINDENPNYITKPLSQKNQNAPPIINKHFPFFPFDNLLSLSILVIHIKFTSNQHSSNLLCTSTEWSWNRRKF